MQRSKQIFVDGRLSRRQFGTMLGQIAVLSAVQQTRLNARPARATTILLAPGASELEQYAARELQRYLSLVTGELLAIVPEAGSHQDAIVIGIKSSPLILRARLNWAAVGPQGYWLHKTGNRLFIAGSDPEGVLYGVYGLLADHYGVTFLMSGDILPLPSPFRLAEVSETRTPRQSIRGFSNHWCYMQGAGTWSLEDWKYHIDQMARMRMNLLSVHNYIFEGYRENWLNWGAFSQKNLNQNSAQGAFYHWCSWPQREYPGQGADLFDDYAFGSKASLHAASLSNQETWQRCAATFQQIIAHAHRRGVKVALGSEFHRLPPIEQAELCESILHWHPNLDYLVYYRHETTEEPPFVRAIYDFFRQKAPRMRHVLTGWGQLTRENLNSVPADVVAGPFTAYKDTFEDGSFYETRAYWAGPWLEEDNTGGMHYMPRSKSLTQIISSYNRRAANMTGLVSLTWRLTDAIDPRIYYIASAPWDLNNAFVTSHALYADYARRCYGPEIAETVAAILDQNEAIPPDARDCRIGGDLTGITPTADRTQTGKAEDQLVLLDACLAKTADAGRAACLGLLRSRILGARLHMKLAGQKWDTAAAIAEEWSRSYMARVTDASTLGQFVSNQQMVMQYYVVKLENDFRFTQQVKFPSRVAVRRTSDGVLVTWRNEEPACTGFYVYHNGKKLNDMPLRRDATSIIVKNAEGHGSYRVSVLSAEGVESAQSAPATADFSAPRVVVISPPTTAIAGLPIDIEARIESGFVPEAVTAEIAFRPLGSSGWQWLPMIRRCHSIFTVRLPAEDARAGGLEYIVTAKAGSETARYPICAPHHPASITIEAIPLQPVASTSVSLGLNRDGKTLQWQPAGGDIRWYRLYRSREAGFVPGPATLVTYFYRDTTAFADLEPEFEDRPLSGIYYYRVTAVCSGGKEGLPSQSVKVSYPIPTGWETSSCPLML